MKKTVLILMALILCIPVVVFGAQGQPFQQLQDEINQINTQLQNLTNQVQALQQTGSAGIGVYDANDVFLGYTLSFPEATQAVTLMGTAPTIYIPTLGKLITISLTTGMIASESFFYYTTQNCSGEAYVTQIGSYHITASIYIPSPPPPAGSPLPQAFYVGVGHPQPLTMLSSSTTYPYLGGGDCNTVPQPLPVYFVPLTQVSLPFPTPVALPLKYKLGTN